MAKQSKGFCKYCGKAYTRSGMLRHLESCKQRASRLESENTKTRRGYFELSICGRYNKNYWLIIEISENATLETLDRFLRDIWLECCGHLSSFEINGESYDVMPDTDDLWGAPAKSMNYKIKDVLSVGTSFTYEYDFGSTTELFLSVHAYRIGAVHRKQNIVILSRNNPADIVCSQCGTNRAEWIDQEAYYDEEPFWCEECLEKADEEPEYLLRICNSPRMGVCAYNGSEIYPDQFEPDQPDDNGKK